MLGLKENLHTVVVVWTYFVNNLFNEALSGIFEASVLISTSDFPFPRFWCDSGCSHRSGPAKYWQLGYPLPNYKSGPKVAQGQTVCHQPSHWSHQSRCSWTRPRGEAHLACLGVLSHLSVVVICFKQTIPFSCVQLILPCDLWFTLNKTDWKGGFWSYFKLVHETSECGFWHGLV